MTTVYEFRNCTLPSIPHTRYLEHGYPLSAVTTEYIERLERIRSEIAVLDEDLERKKLEYNFADEVMHNWHFAEFDAKVQVYMDVFDEFQKYLDGEVS